MLRDGKVEELGDQGYGCHQLPDIAIIEMRPMESAK
jgi:hypothetical protein